MTPTARPPDRPTALLLGVDVGGSHSSAVVSGPDLVPLARADGPGAPMRPGRAEATTVVVADVAGRAARRAGVTLPVDAAVIGAAGAGRAMEQEELAQALTAQGVARTVRVVADAEIALAAAFEQGPGIIVTAGTGSIAYARDPRGAIHRAGGYGWQLGDEGGGYWVGRRALEAAGKAYDGRGEGSTLQARLLVALGLHDFADLVRWTSLAVPAQIAALAPHLLNAARDGEVVAKQVVQLAAQELVGLVAALARRFPPGSELTVATGGGLLSLQSPLYAAFRETLTRALPAVRLRADAIDPPLGALRLAAELIES